MSTTTCNRCGGLGVVENRGDNSLLLTPRVCTSCVGTGKKERPVYIGLEMAKERGK